MVAHRIKQAYDADGRLPQNHVRILHGLPLSRGQKLVQLFQPAWISTTNVFLSFLEQSTHSTCTEKLVD